MKLAIVAFIGFISFNEILASIDQTCIQKGQSGNCDFYQCFESRRQCGWSGYLIGYGSKFCNKFKTYYNSFTQAGKNWIDCVRLCLTKKLVGKYQEPFGSVQHCEKLKIVAFDTHASCYLDCGLCSIYDSNTLALNRVYDASDSLTSDAVKQLKDVAASCRS